MLTQLRASAHGIFAKILLGLLVLSFGIWGIGDIFRQGGGVSIVADIGKTGISVQEFQRALHRKQEEYRQMLGKSYTPEMAKHLGIDLEVLSGLINNALLEKEAAALGIAVGDDDIADYIQKMPTFQDEKGHFSTTLYLETLREQGKTEQGFIQDLRKDISVKLLVDILTTAPQSEELVNAVYHKREERRSAMLLVLPPGMVAAPEPTDADLKAYYDTHTHDYSAPETRTLSYVALTPAAIEAKMDVSPDEVAREYDERKQEFHRPERWTLDQMTFEKKEDAEQAFKQIGNGKSFDAVAAKAPLSNKGKLAMGDLVKEELPPQASTQILALKEGGVTSPSQSEFGWHVFRVRRILPESTAPLDEVRPQIVKDLAARQSQDTVTKLVATLEDTLASGATLDKAAEKVGQKVEHVGPVTHDGLTPDGKKAALPPYDNFLATAFATGEKEHSQAVQASDGTYFLVQVDQVNPEHTPALAQVKAQAVTAWKKEKAAALLHRAAADIARKLHSGTPVAAALGSQRLSVQPVASGLVRRGEGPLASGPLKGKILPGPLLVELFQLAPQHSTDAYAMEDGRMVIATLTQIVSPPAPKDPRSGVMVDAIRKDLKQTLANERLYHYLVYLRAKYPVSIHESALGLPQGDE